MIAKFKRGDGVEFEAEIGSMSFELMEKDGSFTRMDVEAPAQERTLGAGTEPVEIDLSKLNKKQLLEEAAKAGVEATEEMTKAQIVEAIEAKAATTEDEN